VETLQIALAIGLLVFLAILLALNGFFKKRLNLAERLTTAKKTSSNEESAFTNLRKRFEQLLIPIGEMLPRSPEEMSRQERKLVQAGIRRKDAVLLLNAAHVVVAVLILIAFWSGGYLFHRPILFGLLSIMGGAALPDMWLKSQIERRKRNIQHALPDAMDLAVVSVEAGLGLDQALMRVGDEIRVAHPDLADELRLRNLEVNMGRSRSDAFRNLAERTGVEDLKALVAILIQTDRFGTSIGQALRTFSDSLRIKRRQRAEEQAAKLAIKMVVPMVVFIFPGVFVVVLGPAFLAIIRDLLPGLAGR
jgi:tight adherence protein C